MNLLFTGTVSADHKLKLDNLSDFNSHLATLSGKRIQLTVEKMKHRRSNQQNRYLWGVVYKLIADHTGHTPDELHSAFKVAFSPKVYLGSLAVPKSTRTQDTLEMNEYIEKIKQWAAEELNINIPDPNAVQV